ncbi:hypothetical protein GOODEAATRI_005923, partial [Goodea atripinnis]
MFEQRPFRHTEHFHHPSDSCRTCVCNNGTVRCQHKPCPFAQCSHPITQDCCRTCEGTHSHVPAPQHRKICLFTASFLQAACTRVESESVVR